MDLYEELKTLSAREEEAVKHLIADQVYLTNVDMIPDLVASGIYRPDSANTAEFDPSGIQPLTRTCDHCADTVETTETATPSPKPKQVYLRDQALRLHVALEAADILREIDTEIRNRYWTKA